ncbi:hypothetical protein TNCT_292441 [Trichonephila clavata]|uniref:Uncharacterized protein n=1 Tax=Trichonephila clavata TaxID=2740835 RepID=A0A8X6KR03_TRICU|nr:hypothetical protein TNCT_292441 [Trichonephila clavata]
MVDVDRVYNEKSWVQTNSFEGTLVPTATGLRTPELDHNNKKTMTELTSVVLHKNGVKCVPQYSKKLVHSLPHRMVAVIAKGDHNFLTYFLEKKISHLDI